MNPWPKHPVIYELNPPIFWRAFMEYPLKFGLNCSP
jgi:hypothetical protein